jgi:hypothetical protein
VYFVQTLAINALELLFYKLRKIKGNRSLTKTGSSYFNGFTIGSLGGFSELKVIVS